MKSSFGGLDNPIEGPQVRWLRPSFEIVHGNFELSLDAILVKTLIVMSELVKIFRMDFCC
jgi:hypothetical protein